MYASKVFKWHYALLALAFCLSACTANNTRPPTSARFLASAQVRIASNTPSAVLYTACGSRFSGMAGVANSGDEGVVLKNEYCGGTWWYQIQVSALKNEKWQGIGWVPEEMLRVK